MRKLNLDDYKLSIQLDGELYADTEAVIGPNTFILDDDGNLIFNDEFPWEDDYFLLEEGKYNYYGGAENNVQS